MEKERRSRAAARVYPQLLVLPSFGFPSELDVTALHFADTAAYHMEAARRPRAMARLNAMARSAAPEAVPIAPAPASSLHPEMIGVSGGGDNNELLQVGL